MKHMPSLILRIACASLLLALGQPHPTSAADEPRPPLVPNADLELDADGDQWPDGWPKLKANGTWEAEEGNHFIRLTSPAPDTMVMMYREIAIPAGVKAIELSWRQRITGLRVGKQVWFDARIMMNFMNAAREKIDPSPKVPYARKDTVGWETKVLRSDVPEGTTTLKFMPSLFQVASGTFDLDDVVVKAIDATPPQ